MANGKDRFVNKDFTKALARDFKITNLDMIPCKYVTEDFEIQGGFYDINNNPKAPMGTKKQDGDSNEFEVTTITIPKGTIIFDRTNTPNLRPEDNIKTRSTGSNFVFDYYVEPGKDVVYNKFATIKDRIKINRYDLGRKIHTFKIEDKDIDILYNGGSISEDVQSYIKNNIPNISINTKTADEWIKALEDNSSEDGNDSAYTKKTYNQIPTETGGKNPVDVTIYFPNSKERPENCIMVCGDKSVCENLKKMSLLVSFDDRAGTTVINTGKNAREEAVEKYTLMVSYTRDQIYRLADEFSRSISYYYFMLDYTYTHIKKSSSDKFFKLLTNDIKNDGYGFDHKTITTNPKAPKPELNNEMTKIFKKSKSSDDIAENWENSVTFDAIHNNFNKSIDDYYNGRIKKEDFKDMFPTATKEEIDALFGNKESIVIKESIDKINSCKLKNTLIEQCIKILNEDDDLKKPRDEQRFDTIWDMICRDNGALTKVAVEIFSAAINEKQHIAAFDLMQKYLGKYEKIPKLGVKKKDQKKEFHSIDRTIAAKSINILKKMYDDTVDKIYAIFNHAIENKNDTTDLIKNALENIKKYIEEDLKNNNASVTNIDFCCDQAYNLILKNLCNNLKNTAATSIEKISKDPNYVPTQKEEELIKTLIEFVKTKQYSDKADEIINQLFGVKNTNMLGNEDKKVFKEIFDKIENILPSENTNPTASSKNDFLQKFSAMASKGDEFEKNIGAIWEMMITPNLPSPIYDGGEINEEKVQNSSEISVKIEACMAMMSDMNRYSEQQIKTDTYIEGENFKKIEKQFNKCYFDGWDEKKIKFDKDLTEEFSNENFNNLLEICKNPSTAIYTPIKIDGDTANIIDRVEYFYDALQYVLVTLSFISQENKNEFLPDYNYSFLQNENIKRVFEHNLKNQISKFKSSMLENLDSRVKELIDLRKRFLSEKMRNNWITNQTSDKFMDEIGNSPAARLYIFENKNYDNEDFNLITDKEKLNSIIENLNNDNYFDTLILDLKNTESENSIKNLYNILGTRWAIIYALNGNLSDNEIANKLKERWKLILKNSNVLDNIRTEVKEHPDVMNMLKQKDDVVKTADDVILRQLEKFGSLLNSNDSDLTEAIRKNNREEFVSIMNNIIKEVSFGESNENIKNPNIIYQQLSKNVNDNIVKKLFKTIKPTLKDSYNIKHDLLQLIMEYTGQSGTVDDLNFGIKTHMRANITDNWGEMIGPVGIQNIHAEIMRGNSKLINLYMKDDNFDTIEHIAFVAFDTAGALLDAEKTLHDKFTYVKGGSISDLVDATGVKTIWKAFNDFNKRIGKQNDHRE